ncbi:IQ motif and SEC7 domain-containing protein 1 [Nematolebias whitei]|uniref:IQ motif and SEC7 domain-containing protein 1 n=1 Tax=Nematolebias whitei TaxID=451745 RepID=UPI00189AFFA9|nr:IQ motif and SEC7 domain-containing protein 1 [Nematolebias whitei]
MDPSGGHSCSPVIHGDAFCPNQLDSQLYAHLFLPGHQQTCKAKLQHSQSLLHKQTEKEAFKDSRLLSENYEPSNVQHKQVEMLEFKYGGRFITRHAARTIQTAFRQYQMNKNSECLRSSMPENHTSTQIILSNMRMQLSFKGPEKFHSSYLEGKQVSLTDDGKVGAPVHSELRGERCMQNKTPTTQNNFPDVITELEDTFSRQVKSLAESIDDALNCHSLHGEDSQSKPKRAHQDTDREQRCKIKASHNSKEMTASYSDVTLYIDEEELSPTLPLSQFVDWHSSTESDSHQLFLSSSHDYCSLVHKNEKENMSTSSHNTPYLECQEQHLWVDHLPALTIEPPSKNLVELHDCSDCSSLKRQITYNQSVSNQQSISQHISHSPLPWGPFKEEKTSAHHPQQMETHLAISGTANLQSKSDSNLSDGDNDSINTSNSNDTINCSSKSSSRDSLREQTLTKQTYHKETCNRWDSPAFSNDIVRKRHYRIGLNLFNKKPEKGIQYMMEQNFVQDTPVGVAHFLLQRKGLSRQMIGEFLGNRQKQFNRDVLDCVVDEMDFSGLELDEGLRKFQAQIRVQGEAQKVERLIEAYSQRYCICNPGMMRQFRNPDTIFILAFAIILLNTDMYSPNIKPERKMTLEDFVKNLRGVDDGEDIPQTMLVGVYERIRKQELKTNEDHVSQVQSVEKLIVRNKLVNNIHGKGCILSLPHRRLVCYCRLFEVPDTNKPQKLGFHQREVFLFNDLLVVTKIFQKRKNSVSYSFRQSFSLNGMQLLLFENQYYFHGVRLTSAVPAADIKVLINFNAANPQDRKKFTDDLKESIAEVQEMEKYQNESELEKQKDVMRSSMPQCLRLKKETKQDNLSLDDSYATGEGLRRSTFSSSLRNLSDAGKRGRSSSAGSLDSSVEGSIISSAVMRRRPPPSRDCPSRHSGRSLPSSFSLLGSLLSTRRLKSPTPHPSKLHQTARGETGTPVPVHPQHAEFCHTTPPPYHHPPPHSEHLPYQHRLSHLHGLPPPPAQALGRIKPKNSGFSTEV